MKFPNVPSPYPTLQKGKSLYHSAHGGFVNVWNWMKDIWQHVSDYFVTSINSTAGDITISGGEGIEVHTSGKTVTIQLGDGEDTNSNKSSHSGGGSGGGAGGGSGSDYGSSDYDDDYEFDDSGSSGGSIGGGGSSGGSEEGSDGGCNDWSEDVDNGAGDGDLSNGGDNCSELNGW
jgi:hypothetical protein